MSRFTNLPIGFLNAPVCKKVIGRFQVFSSVTTAVAVNGLNLPVCEDMQLDISYWTPSAAGTINIAAMAKINLTSLQYLVSSYGNGRNAVTVGLHSQAYAKLTSELISLAASKNISFVTA